MQFYTIFSLSFRKILLYGNFKDEFHEIEIMVFSLISVFFF